MFELFPNIAQGNTHMGTLTREHAQGNTQKGTQKREHSQGNTYKGTCTRDNRDGRPISVRDCLALTWNLRIAVVKNCF